MQPPRGTQRPRGTSPQGGKPPQRPQGGAEEQSRRMPGGQQVITRQPMGSHRGYTQNGAVPRHPSNLPPPPQLHRRWLTGTTRIRKGHVVLALAICCVFAVFLAVGNARVRALELELVASKDVVKGVLEEVEARERQLRFTQTEEYIEREARERYGFMKADELRFLPDGTVQHPEPIILPRDRGTPPPEDLQGEMDAEDEAGAEATAPPA